MSGKTIFFRGYANFLGEISFMYQFLFANRKKSFRIEYPLIYLLQLRFPLFYLIIYLLKLSAQKLVSYQSNLNVIILKTDRCPSLPLSLVYLQLNKILCKMKKKNFKLQSRRRMIPNRDAIWESETWIQFPTISRYWLDRNQDPHLIASKGNPGESKPNSPFRDKRNKEVSQKKKITRNFRRFHACHVKSKKKGFTLHWQIGKIIP